MDKAYKTTFENLSDLEQHTGKEIGLSEWVMLDQQSVNAFGKLTKDEQWIHTDIEKSRQYSPYKTTIAHGFYILSLASYFAESTIAIKGVKMGVNYGLDKVRFISGVPVGARLRARMTLMEYEPLEGGGKYKLNVVFELEGHEKPACVAEWIGVAYV